MASARAMATRCCSPPDNWWGKWWSRSPRPTDSSAAVAAPIVEETMFRGVLYRHLRSATGHLGTGLSILVSGTLNGFLFAAIHPQGWVAIPALIGYRYLRGRVEGLVVQMEKEAITLVEALHRKRYLDALGHQSESR